ncbi:MAG: hypothetical protein M1826_000100 [Phylliscum demangeonii]|nr:MAG: hypothetical protein M1826_000100 [Phylliscum demangeonii]
MATPQAPAPLSRLELVLVYHIPVLESLVRHLPTGSLLGLYQTSRHLRALLNVYSTAWKHLSFRGPGLHVPVGRYDAVGVFEDYYRRQFPEPTPYVLDALLGSVLQHRLGSHLRTIDLDGSGVCWPALQANVLSDPASKVEHFSVRRCLNVSLTFHLYPWLRSLHMRPFPSGGLALKSIYFSGCLHARTSPFPHEQLRRADSEPAILHAFLELCHQSGIWTDMAWCTTPGPRCERRKELYASSTEALGTKIWIPFDRLWRSNNQVGVQPTAQGRIPTLVRQGCLWEEEDGYCGEALGGEGKMVPAHLRRSYRSFVDGITCSDCGEPIPERCERCSVNLHCQGCRKTLCANCAFDRPSGVYHTQKEAAARGLPDRFWWAPLARISPNDITEGEVAADGTALLVPVHERMTWCCEQTAVKPCGYTVPIAGDHQHWAQAKLRAVPLPRGMGFEDLQFVPRGTSGVDVGRVPAPVPRLPLRARDGPVAGYDPGETRPFVSRIPRVLCAPCHASAGWKIDCSACTRPMCADHVIRTRNFRVCGVPQLLASLDEVLVTVRWDELATRPRLPPPPLTAAARRRARSSPPLPAPPPPPFDPLQLLTAADHRMRRRLREYVEQALQSRPPPLFADLVSPATPRNFYRLPTPASAWKGCRAMCCMHRDCVNRGHYCRKCGVFRCPACEETAPLCPCAVCQHVRPCPNCYAKMRAMGECLVAIESSARGTPWAVQHLRAATSLGRSTPNPAQPANEVHMTQLQVMTSAPNYWVWAQPGHVYATNPGPAPAAEPDPGPDPGPTPAPPPSLA